MLPILITIVLIVAIVAVVYLIGSRPKKTTKRPGQRARPTGRGTTSRGATPKKRVRPGYREAPQWVRKLPLLLVVFAVVSLAIALAQFRVAKQRATPVIALVIDSSKSMNATDVTPNRLDAAKAAARDFLAQLPEDFEVALVTFADEPTVLVPATANRDQLSQALGTLPRGTGTVIGDGLNSGISAIEAQWQSGLRGPAAIVLLSDGRDTGSQIQPLDAAAAAAERNIPVYTVVLGADKAGTGGANAELLGQIAEATGGTSTSATSTGELSSVYEHLGAQLSSQLKISSSAQLFVFLAIALAMAAAVAIILTSMIKPT